MRVESSALIWGGGGGCGTGVGGTGRRRRPARSGVGGAAWDRASAQAVPGSRRGPGRWGIGLAGSGLRRGRGRRLCLRNNRAKKPRRGCCAVPAGGPRTGELRGPARPSVRARLASVAARPERSAAAGPTWRRGSAASANAGSWARAPEPRPPAAPAGGVAVSMTCVPQPVGVSSTVPLARSPSQATVVSGVTRVMRISPNCARWRPSESSLLSSAHSSGGDLTRRREAVECVMAGVRAPCADSCRWPRTSRERDKRRSAALGTGPRTRSATLQRGRHHATIRVAHCNTLGEGWTADSPDLRGWSMTSSSYGESKAAPKRPFATHLAEPRRRARRARDHAPHRLLALSRAAGSRPCRPGGERLGMPRPFSRHRGRTDRRRPRHEGRGRILVSVSGAGAPSATW